MHVILEDQIDWEFLRGMMQTVFYGNRIDRHFDFTVLLAYLQQNFNSSVISGRMMELKDNIRIPSSTRIQVTLFTLINFFYSPNNLETLGLHKRDRKSISKRRYTIIIWITSKYQQCMGNKAQYNFAAKTKKRSN